MKQAEFDLEVIENQLKEKYSKEQQL